MTMDAFETGGLALTVGEAALRGCLLTLIAAAALLLIRRRSAAAECAVWGGVLAASLAMPIVMAVTPPIFLRSAEPAPVSEAPTGETLFALAGAADRGLAIAPTSAPFDWLTAVYGLGLAAGLLRLSLGFAAGAALRRRSKPARIDAPFDVRESDAVSVPITFGWPRGFVVLPAAWPFWDEKKLKAVLLHEGAHIARGDFLLNALANLNAAIFWFSPHAWWLKRRLTDASEQASDDRALAMLGDRAFYADVLLSFAGRKTAVSSALPMARGAVSARIERALDGARPLTAALGLKAGLVLGATLSAAAYFAAGVSLAEAPAVPSRSADLRPAAPPAPPEAPRPAPAPKPSPVAAPSPAAAPAPAEAPSAPQAPEAPDAPLSDDWNDVDAALEGAEDETDKSEISRNYGSRSWSSWSHSSGDGDDHFAVSLRDDGVEFVKDKKRYVIKDGESCKKVKEYVEPMNELGEEQSALGEEQSRLGEAMSRLAERRQRITVETGALKARIRVGMAEIDALASDDRLTQEVLGEIQSRLGDLQGELGELQGKAGERQAEFSEQQEELAAEMQELARQQAELGQRQAEVSRKAEMKIRSLIETALRDGRAERVN